MSLFGQAFPLGAPVTYVPSGSGIGDKSIYGIVYNGQVMAPLPWGSVASVPRENISMYAASISRMQRSAVYSMNSYGFIIDTCAWRIDIPAPPGIPGITAFALNMGMNSACTGAVASAFATRVTSQ